MSYNNKIKRNTSSNIVSKQSNRSITFKATTNKVEPTAVVHGCVPSKQMSRIIQQNSTFEKAFQKPAPSGGGTVNDGAFPMPPDVFMGGGASTGSKTAATIIQSSASGDDGKSSSVSGAEYGLVSAIQHAYNTHHNLVLRPDDIWQAILTQFSFYVNAHAEELRDKFVDFEGKKKLTIEMYGNLFSVNFGEFANRMVDEQIKTNIKDPEVTDWLLPGFTTTRVADRVAASVTIMSTLQSYFSYGCMLMCGIPEVTLLGTLEDWRSLRNKVDGLLKYDVNGSKVMKQWSKLLATVIDQMILSVEGKPDIGFWDTVCSYKGGGSGPTYLSGWVTAFAVFDQKGDWQGGVPTGRSWPQIETGDIPVGTISVPVLVNDNGVEYDTQMIAGQFAYDVIGENRDTIQPRTDCCIAYEK